MTISRVHRYCAVLLILGSLLTVGIAQQPQSQRMDEWKALEISLKDAKSIHPKNGFVPDEATAVKIGDAAASGNTERRSFQKSGRFVLDCMTIRG